ncbi:MAG: cysteine--tRNA ligase [Candidatus Berkiella sp.]
MLQIYNTFTQRKEEFKAIHPGKIHLYVCGITVYDYCHIGHARVFVSFDVITRFLRASGWDVTYVRNITDIDDKIIKRALENNEAITDLTERFIQYMQEDEAKLNVIRPNQEPRATHYMDKIISMVQAIQDNGLAYQAENGDVYFAVQKYKSYGELSHKNIDELMVGARVDVQEAKRSPLDFVLWKKSKANEPSWASPWGDGRPGWHIECSAMSTDCLGDHFDIHGGGADLVFPHHENERAQSESATHKTFVNHWMHVGFVQVSKEKMSKSLGNFFTIREVLAQYDAEVVRYFLISSHYRSPVNYSLENLDQAKQSIGRLYTALKGLDLNKTSKHAALAKDNPWKEKFFQAMNDDFNTPQALAVMFDLANKINIAKTENIAVANELANTLLFLGEILGILDKEVELFFKGDNPENDAIELLIAERIQARTEKNWAKADQIRKQLTEMGIAIEDSEKGSTWRKL